MTAEEINLRALAQSTLNPTLADLCVKSADRLAELRALLREIDDKVIFEAVIHDGTAHDLQRRIERALGIGTRPPDGDDNA